MNASTAHDPAKEILVGMGQIATGRAPRRLRAILGSCIALALYHPGRRAGAMAHIVLPNAEGRSGNAGKFADTAVPRMLEILREQGAPAVGLTAKLAGGAQMFSGSGPLRIGQANAAAVAAALKKAGIRVTAEDTGGTRGRRVDFDCDSGAMIIQSAGLPPRTL